MASQRDVGGGLTPDDAHYGAAGEADRLSRGAGALEFARSWELLARFLLPPPAVVFDIGGGPGRYAFALAADGYTVHLIDLLPLHIEQARRIAAASGPPLAGLSVGDARRLDAADGAADGAADAVLLMG